MTLVRVVGAAAAVACAGLLTAAPAWGTGAASTFSVSGFGDGNGACAPPDANGNSVCPTLRAAVVQASKQGNGPTIYLQAGTFQLTLANGGQLDLASSMNIVGVGPGGSSGTTIRQTDGKDRVLRVDGGPTMLTGVEITGGHLAPTSSPACTSEPWAGGGILALATLSLEHVLVDGNQVVAPTGPSGSEADCVQGGGIAYINGGGGQINDSTIAGNSATGGAGGTGGGSGGQAYGGGIADIGGASLIVELSTIAQNTATGGSATSSGGDGGSAWGGGIFISGSATTTVAQLVNSTIFGSSAHGGSAATGGSPGSGAGGGFLAQGAKAKPTLQSDTIDANQADGDGNLSVAVGSEPFTIHDTILAGGSPTNCGIANPPTSESYNLEDDAAGSCGFTPASHDLVGANPELPSTLADNGGLTQTFAPAPGSPALGAGGRCLDPTSTPPNQPLGIDQRGQPRPASCDIGAFQAQPPTNTSHPAISGRPVRGQTLICSEGTWSGDGPFVLAFQWLRNGLPIPGASTNTYVVAATDAGRSLACQVTASHYGSVATTTSFVIVPSYPLITLLKASASPSAVVVSLGCRGPDGERCRGLLKLTLVEKLRGRRVIGVAAARARTLTAGRRSYVLLARHTTTLRIALTRMALKLLSRFKQLRVTLTVTQTTAAGTATIVSRRLRIRLPHVSRG